MNKFFSDVLTIVNGKNQRAVENPNGKYPIYGSGGIMGYADNYLCDAETVIIGRKGSINKPIFVEEPFWNVDTAFGLVANKTVLLPKYLFYFCVNYDFEKLNKTVTIPSLTKSDLLKIEIDIPSIIFQQSVVEKLDRVGNCIELLKMQLQKLNELIKSRFVEMFGDIGTNSKGWLLSPLEEVAEIRIGPFGSLLHKEDYVCNCHALVNPSHIVDGKIKTDEKLTINNEKYQEMSAYHLQKDDIVLGRRGEMGRCAVVEQEGLLCGTGSMIIRPNGKIKPFFLQTILSSPLYKRILEDKAVGVTMLNLNIPIVSSISIPLLPIELQDRFIELLQSVEKQKATVQQSIDKLETLKKSLTQDYFG